ncbi:UDP-N-acetylglucosamine 2-epimerase (non-hydrolyzing) [Capnocytophaga stomatis]|uniref:UDP-N-acetylglucosamine 2-epimerase (Non-hydrolyzing) n=2 Tax=Capnocytophaga stomatis TaxID=1848904 RepID=A0A250FZ68_9FLAO|nr:UDP-N-acetylglucosamine 2-epimerase (non-hydrolyzing) [Capnocytophaga stomatis]
MKTKKIIVVVGTRPNFIKIAPLIPHFIYQKAIKFIIVHTGQHYDDKMSSHFFTDLDIPLPNINLGVGSGSQTVQTAKIMERFEKVCLNERPEYVFVVGDVNSTIACSLVAAKLRIKIIHYEAGLRSYDKSMPEEINRRVTDSISDFYFTTTEDATSNLIKENISNEKIFMLGNLMIDTLISQLPKAMIKEFELNRYSNSKVPLVSTDFKEKKYGIVTLHRSGNVDSKEFLTDIIQELGSISQKVPLVFPMHFRTLKNIQEWNLIYLIERYPNLFVVEPLGYLHFLNLLSKSLFVITDSGGIQEETTYLDIPCLTLRANTERPITVWIGSNKLTTITELSNEIDLIIKGLHKKRKEIPKFWDGKTANRIIEQLQKIDT